MYCTISSLDPSRGELSADARRSLVELRAKARTLGTLAASLSRQADEVTRAYERALTEGSEAAWAAFVRSADGFATHGTSAVGLLHLGERERAAARFFANIVRENADLLPDPVFA